ncbi:MAG: Crp/Fnr family transcriptional regulator [Bacteroidales bacterium]|jgi:CRP-like cAMP-binding protein|nr:Crp/Fnr family transcriptional regulator [Bacteroidales bacterium]
MDCTSNDIASIFHEKSFLFYELSHADKHDIQRHHIKTDHAKGSYIIREGEKAKGLIWLVQGKAKIFRTGVGNREQIIKLLKEKDIFAFHSLSDDTPHPYSAMAIEGSSTITMEKKCMIRILRSNTVLSGKLMQLMSDEMSFLINRLVSLTQKHVRSRVAESLLLMRDTYGFEKDGQTLEVLLSRSDIAHLSNMITSNAIRTLSSFSSEKIIGLDGRRIKILNPALLEQISEQG